jgi:hypothetical protein
VRAPALWFAFACCVAAHAFGCARPAPVRPAEPPERELRATAAPWPEADALFRSDPRWLGGDAAVSVALDGERVLWLFGDSFIAAEATEPPRSRHGARFVRNSAALQRGLDPSRAELRFYFGTGPDGAPASFFAEQGECWRWPGQGLWLDGVLTLFLIEVCPEAGGASGLGFRVAGWAAVRALDASGEPSSWQLAPLATPKTPGVIPGAALLARGEHVYAYGVREPGDHAVVLLRWPRAQFVRGELLQPEWYAGDARGFALDGPALPVIDRAATELSVTPAPAGGYVAVHARGFGAAKIALRFASRLEGPFGAPLDVYLPPEAERPGVLIYAGRAHPELTGADLVLTYATNTLDADALQNDLSLYFPRFVRVGL